MKTIEEIHRELDALKGVIDGFIKLEALGDDATEAALNYVINAFWKPVLKRRADALRALACRNCGLNAKTFKNRWTGLTMCSECGDEYAPAGAQLVADSAEIPSSERE